LSPSAPIVLRYPKEENTGMLADGEDAEIENDCVMIDVGFNVSPLEVVDHSVSVLPTTDTETTPDPAVEVAATSSPFVSDSTVAIFWAVIAPVGPMGISFGAPVDVLTKVYV
jgi:hypothetical protein